MKKGNYIEKIEFLTAKDIQEMRGIALGSVYKLMAKPGFPRIKVSDRRFVIPKKAFERWIEEQTNP